MLRKTFLLFLVLFSRTSVFASEANLKIPTLNDDQQSILIAVVKREGESYVKDFQPLKLGTFQLEKGRGELTLRALDVAGALVMEVRAVTLTLLKN